MGAIELQIRLLGFSSQGTTGKIDGNWMSKVSATNEVLRPKMALKAISGNLFAASQLKIGVFTGLEKEDIEFQSGWWLYLAVSHMLNFRQDRRVTNSMRIEGMHEDRMCMLIGSETPA